MRCICSCSFDFGDERDSAELKKVQRRHGKVVSDMESLLKLKNRKYSLAWEGKKKIEYVVIKLRVH